MTYVISTPPHLKADQDIGNIMRIVCLALVPAYAWAFYNFGWYAMMISGLCVVACMATEAVCQRLREVEVTVNDGSAVVTGLLLAAVLPPNVSWYVPVIGGVFAIGVAKQAFGGLGNNIWNPALLARAFLQVAYASQINSGSWVRTGAEGAANLTTSLHGTFADLAEHPDVVSGATTLAKIARPVVEAGQDASYAIATDSQELWMSFLGREGGTIAEVSALFLLIGGLYMLAKKVITWDIPIPYIATVALLTWMLPAPVQVAGEGGALTVAYTGWFCGPWLIHMVGGGLMIGAFFMATDMVTSPVSRKGRIIFGIGCGVLTTVIRVYSSAYPEGVCYSILLMNTCVPLIDSWTRPRVFGQKKTAA